MTSVQKVIKYLAIAFAIYLSVNIIGCIIWGLSGIAYIFSDAEAEMVGEMTSYPIEGEVSELSFELSGAELIIETAEEFSLESNHQYISVKTENGKLTVRETKKLFAFTTKGATVRLSIPKDHVFEYVSIDTGAGKVKIDALTADSLELHLGAGKVEIENLTANTRAKIDGGVGEVNIKGGKLCNLEFDVGVGAMTLESRIEGNSSIDCGVGESKLILLGSRDEYKIELDKGLGQALIEGEIMKDDSVYGNGEHFIEMDGGIGGMCVSFSAEQ